MNFEDERYVRVYTRKTVTTKLLGWDGRMCLYALLLEVDRAGVLDLEGLDPAEALSALADLPLEHAQTGMAKLLQRGVVVVTNGVLFVPNFIRAQEAAQSDKQRQRESRARRAAAARAAELPGVPPELAAVAVTVLETASHAVTIRDGESPPVTERHDQSHAVTTGHSVLSRAQPCRTKPAEPEIPRERGEAPPPQLPQTADHPNHVKPPTNLTEALRLPITQRAEFVERNKHLADWTEPQKWPEVLAVAQLVHEHGGGRGQLRLAPFGRDRGVQALVTLFAAGFELGELEHVARTITRRPWWTSGEGGKPRSLGALTVEVVRRELAEAPANTEPELSPATRAQLERDRSAMDLMREANGQAPRRPPGPGPRPAPPAGAGALVTDLSRTLGGRV